MTLMKQIVFIAGFVLSVVVCFIFTGINVYVLKQIGDAGSIPLLSSFSNILGNWGATWLPIILLVGGIAIIVGLLIHGFR